MDKKQEEQIRYGAAAFFIWLFAGLILGSAISKVVMYVYYSLSFVAVVIFVFLIIKFRWFRRPSKYGGSSKAVEAEWDNVRKL